MKSLSFITQFKIEFSQLFTDFRKVLGKMSNHTNTNTPNPNIRIEKWYETETSDGNQSCGQRLVV